MAYYYDDGPESGAYNTELNIREELQVGGNRPRVMLMGLRLSGKTSIVRTILGMTRPDRTLFLESTQQIETHAVYSFITFNIMDFPGQIDYVGQQPSISSQLLFHGNTAVVFVIDSVDELNLPEALERLRETITVAYTANPNIHFDIFLHKVDIVVEDSHIDLKRDMETRVREELADSDMEDIPAINFHLTSILDNSILEAMSRVVQRMVRELPYLESLLNRLVMSCVMEKAFLFDTRTKIFIATDSSPMDSSMLTLCTDFVDLVIDMVGVYHNESASYLPAAANSQKPADEEVPSATPTTTCLPNGHGYSYTPVTSVVELQNKMTLYFREIDMHLCLVCLARSEMFHKQRAVAEGNFDVFRQAILEIFEVRQKMDTTASQSTS